MSECTSSNGVWNQIILPSYIQPEWAMAAADFSAYSFPLNPVPKRHFPAPKCRILPSRRGNPISFPPHPSLKKQKKIQHNRKPQPRTLGGKPTIHITSRPGDGPPPASPLQTVLWGALAPPPPHPPRPSPPRSLLLLPLPPPHPEVGW